MKRRDMFQVALRGGVIATVTRLPADEPADAAEAEPSPKVEFQKGKLRGGKFEGWEALLAITGKAVRGTIYDPGSVGGARFTGYRVRGTARGAIMDLDFYELEDVAFEKPVGGGRGRDKAKKTTTRFEIEGKGLAGKETGVMTSTSVTLPPSRNRPLAGNYSVGLSHGETGEELGHLNLAADRTGKFQMDRISVADSPAAPKTVAGRFGAARNGDIYATTLLPKLAPGDLNFDPSEVQVIRPTGKANGAAAIQVDVEFFLCECIRATWCTLTRSLNATILDPSGQPVVGASVTFIANDTEVGTDITDNMGRANASVFSEDFQWKARVSAHSYVPKVTELFEMTVQVITVTLARQQEVAVSGRVIEELKGRDVPVGGASLRLLQPRDRQVLYTSQTGSNGRFSFPAIAINEAYLLSVSKPGYITSETEVRFSQATNNLEVTLTRGSSTRFFDGDFSEVWLSSLLGPAGPARVNAERVAEGGNDGPYRAEWVTGIEKQATAAHMKASALWDPATGSISGISFSFDIMHVSGSPEAPPLTAYYLALRQGDDTFLRYAGDAIAGRWISVGGANLIPTDFIPLNGDTPPDFSLDGSPIQFGYAVIKDGREFSNRTGIDNWSVTVEH